jgi:hypothetical protein
VVPESLLQDLHDLEVGTSSLSSTLVRERNPCVLVYKGTCPNSNHYSITNR